MDAMINVGVQKDAVEEVRGIIFEILDSNNSEAVKIKALDVLQNMCNTGNTSINDCTFTSTYSDKDNDQEKETYT